MDHSECIQKCFAWVILIVACTNFIIGSTALVYMEVCKYLETKKGKKNV